MTTTSLDSSEMPATGLARSQWKRRQRMLDAAEELASAGGFANVQMREVSRIADVALGTLYRYFPSKEHLLVALLVRQLEAVRERFRSHPPKGGTPHERVLALIMRVTQAMDENPELTMAMTRALIVADVTMSHEVADSQRVLADMIVWAMHPEEETATEEDLRVARVLQRVWLGAYVAWTSGRASSKQVQEDLRVAVDLVLGNGAAAAKAAPAKAATRKAPARKAAPRKAPAKS